MLDPLKKNKTNKLPLPARLFIHLSIIVVIIFAAWLIIPRPSTESTSEDSINLTTESLQKALNDFKVSKEELQLSKENRRLAEFGRKLFFETKFSETGDISCATCHIPSRSFTDARRFAKGVDVGTINTPPIINMGLNFWFFWDGRTDSLAAQAIQPIENPLEYNSNRLNVVTVLKKDYKKEYESLFGKLPKAVVNLEDKAALPRPLQLKLDPEIASYALETMQNFKLLQEAIRAAQKESLSPAEKLSQIALKPPHYPEEWIQNWEQLAEKQKIAINQVFANFGLALQAYEKTIVAYNSPFDLFVENILQGKSIESSFNPGFQKEELAGLDLFLNKGNCTLCHNGPNFSDQQFHNIGLPLNTDPDAAALDIGRSTGIIKLLKSPFTCKGPYLKQDIELESCAELPYLVSNNIEHLGAFKTPTLRNLAFTAPYTHDGRFKTLDEMLNHYNLLEAKAAIGHREDSLRPLDLSEVELLNLKHFLLSLSSPVIDLTVNEDIPQIK